MNVLKYYSLLVVGVMVLVIMARPPAAQGQNIMKCRGGIIGVGSTEYDVLQACGRPRDIIREATRSVWIYDLGSTKFTRYLTMVGGRVQWIKTVKSHF